MNIHSPLLPFASSRRQRFLLFSLSIVQRQGCTTTNSNFPSPGLDKNTYDTHDTFPMRMYPPLLCCADGVGGRGAVVLANSLSFFCTYPWALGTPTCSFMLCTFLICPTVRGIHLYMCILFLLPILTPQLQHVGAFPEITPSDPAIIAPAQHLPMAKPAPIDSIWPHMQPGPTA